MTDTFILSRTGAEVEALQSDYTGSLYPRLYNSVDYPIGMTVRFNGENYIKKSNTQGAIPDPSSSPDWEKRGTYMPRIESDGGSIGFDQNGVAWVTDNASGSSANPGGNGWWEIGGAKGPYKDVTDSITPGVVYTNNEKYTIHILIAVKLSTPTAVIRTLTIDGIAFELSSNYITGQSDSLSFSLPIPPGSTYSISGSFSQFLELR